MKNVVAGYEGCGGKQPSPSRLRRATSPEGRGFGLSTSASPYKVTRGGGENAPVLTSIQIVITDGNPAKGEGGTSKNGDVGRGFVKITRGKSAALIEF